MPPFLHVFFIFLIIFITFIHGSPLGSDEKKDGKIVGGKPVPFDQFAWELSIGLAKNQRRTPEERQAQPPLYKEGSHHCDGVLIANNWVMTAAHCGVNEHTHVPYQPEDLLVGYQSKDLHQVYDHGRYPVAEIILKPGHSHDQSTSPNDIALLRLAHPFPFPPNPPPTAQQQSSPYACLPLPSSDMIHYNSPLISIGFGNVHALYYQLESNEIISGIQPTRYLKEIEVVDITDQAETNIRAQYCRGRYDLICITAVQDPESTCQGDSGGSLIAMEANLVVGITSFGDAIKLDAYQKTCIGDTAYTRLTLHTDWIRSYVPSVCLK